MDTIAAKWIGTGWWSRGNEGGIQFCHDGQTGFRRDWTTGELALDENYRDWTVNE